MSAGAPLVSPRDLAEVVRQIVSEVLMVPVETVLPGSALVEELGAESIDFLDFVFRLEQAIGKKIPVARWTAFVAERLPGQPLSSAITTGILREFAEQEAASP